MKTYYAHGKILLCGEYAVMQGMESLALPVNAGQWLRVWEVPSQGNAGLVWQSKDADGSIWFESIIDTEIMHVKANNDELVSNTLVKILQYVKSINPHFFEHKMIRVETDCEFDRSHGLGSSSTLVALVAIWCGIDPFALQQKVFQGSGYDVAVSMVGKPLVYWLEGENKHWAPWKLPDDISKNWFLAFPGKKMNSRTSVAEIKTKIENLIKNPMMWQQLKMCVDSLKNPGSVALTEAMLEMWQALLASGLGIPRAYEDLQIQPIKGGLCKWLGAWGGDVLLVNQTIKDCYPSVFSTMQIIPWGEFVLQPNRIPQS